MYTMIWRENYQDKWDRFVSEEDVLSKLEEIRANPDACPLGDVWIFTPKADDYVVIGDNFRGDIYV